MRLTAIAVLFFTLPATLWAQDKDVLSTFLQDNLSGDNRYVTVTGLDGALSSQARIEKLTVADNDGIWLTMLGAELDWKRLDLLRGRLTINTLSARQITISRRPGTTDTDLPAPEAGAFSLPDIPIAISLGVLRIDRIVLAKDVIGPAAVLSASGAITLAEGALDVQLALNRLDRDGDRAGLMVRFDTSTQQLSLDLSLTEAANGMLANALNIPDRPSLQLGVRGAGPIRAFSANITLASDATPRLSGQITVTRTAQQPETRLRANLSGDLRALMTRQYQPFFGADTALLFDAKIGPEGRFVVDQFLLTSDSLTLGGDMAVTASGAVEHVTLRGAISPPTGTRVVLPIAGPRTEIRAANLSAEYDGSVSNHWQMMLNLDGLSRADMALQHAHIQASGQVPDTVGHHLKGDITAAISGLRLADADLQQAIGPDITLDGAFLLDGLTSAHLSHFVLQGRDYSATIDGTLSGLSSGFSLDGSASVKASNLSRFARLAKRQLGGAITAQITGNGSVLGGQFDVRLDAMARDLSTGTADLDALLGGQTTLALDITRDETGVTIRHFQLHGTALKARATGHANSRDATFEFTARLDDLGRVVKQAPGPVDVQGSLQLQDTLWTGIVRVDGAHASHVEMTGRYGDGIADLHYDARLARIERFLPDFSGTVISSGQARRTDAGTDTGIWRINGKATGPAGTAAQLSGTLNETAGTVDLGANGQLRLAIVNQLIAPMSAKGAATFNLTLKGKPGLNALAGTLNIAGASIALPHIANAITDLDGTLILANAQAQIALRGGLRSGGGFAVDGPVALTAPYRSTLAVQLDQIILTDNISYTSTANGKLLYAGALGGNGQLSGEIEFGKTEINIAATGGAGSAAAIPDIRHLNEPAEVRRSRARAGLIQSKSGSSSTPNIGLNIRLFANNRIFVRGRGLQAELGGNIHIRGTTKQAEPAGQVTLIRGNLDILGKRLTLTKGIVTLQGSLEPYIEFAASTTTSDGSATIEMIGPLAQPEINVYSDPDRPSEEALAMLLFGNQFSKLSPLKIAQMAVSLAQLRGKSGGRTQGKIRKGLGVDTVDLTQDSDGNTKFTAGAYISDNIYTDLSVNTKGDTELNLNLDVTDNLTLKGTVSSTGSNGLGLFFERDY